MAVVTRYGAISPANGYLRGQGELHMGPCHDKNTMMETVMMMMMMMM